MKLHQSLHHGNIFIVCNTRLGGRIFWSAKFLLPFQVLLPCIFFPHLSFCVGLVCAWTRFEHSSESDCFTSVNLFRFYYVSILILLSKAAQQVQQLPVVENMPDQTKCMFLFSQELIKAVVSSCNSWHSIVFVSPGIFRLNYCN